MKETVGPESWRSSRDGSFIQSFYVNIEYQSNLKLVCCKAVNNIRHKLCGTNYEK